MRRPDRIEAIIAAVAEAHRVSPADITGPSLARAHSAARLEAMARCRELVFADGKPPSFPQIGRWFGRHHTCALNAWRKVGPAQQDLFEVAA